MDQASARVYPSKQADASGFCRLARRLMLRGLSSIQEGRLEVRTHEGTMAFGNPLADLQAVALIHDDRAFLWGLLRGEVGLGEAYVAGHWSSPDPVAVVRLAVRNMKAFDQNGGVLGWLGKTWTRLRHRRRANTVEGSRRNIHAHYDLGNDFYRLWLDPTMAYSCAFFEREDQSLEEAQRAKFDKICRKLTLSPTDHLLEIGTGWGGFALHAARTTGCRVTTTTISREQYAHARALVKAHGLEDRIEVLLQDYRTLEGRFDKAVSIEMFEAVGLAFYDTYFRTVDRLLKPNGSFLLQTITMNERRFPDYIRSTDWIQQYVFPGAELASVREILASLGRCTSLALHHLEDIGLHYAHTLKAWRDAVHARRQEILDLGFDARFLRLWDYYLVTCEGGFRERYIGDAQLLLVKQGTQMALPDEPWARP